MRTRGSRLKVKLSVLIWFVLLCLLPFAVARAANTYSTGVALETVFTPYINRIINGNGATPELLVSPIIATSNVTGYLSLFATILLGLILGLTVDSSALLEAHEGLYWRVGDEPYPTQARRSMDASRSGPTPTLDTGTPRSCSTVWI